MAEYEDRVHLPQLKPQKYIHMRNSFSWKTNWKLAGKMFIQTKLQEGSPHNQLEVEKKKKGIRSGPVPLGESVMK